MKRIALIAAVAAGMLLGAATFARAADDARPNLLIVHTDEHHFNTLGCYGGQVVETPAVDWMAENGVLCTSFYASTPVCSPSRASLISGMYPHNTPVETNNIPLYDDIVSFAEVLGDNGYATGYAGKWHLDGDGKPQWAPERQFGFDDNRFMFNRGHWKKFGDTAAGPQVAARNDKDQPTYSVDNADEKSFATDWLTDKAIEFIDENADKPFCYMVSLPDPHGPNTVRAPYDTMYTDVDFEIPATFERTPDQIPGWGKPEKVKAENLKGFMPQYYGMVKCIDDNLARVLKKLEEKEILDNTIVVFTSDHGDLCGEHGRLNKGVPYEGSAKVAFVAYYPKKIPAGTVVDEALGTVDFMPTMLSMMGVDCPATVEGRDASALLEGKKPADWKDISFLRGTGDWICAVTDDYKLVLSNQDTPWLFDLKKDPNEVVNCYDDPAYADIVKQLATDLKGYLADSNDPRGENEKFQQELAEAMAK